MPNWRDGGLDPMIAGALGAALFGKALYEKAQKIAEIYFMITHYGYSDGSGEYYITIDSDKCNGCGICVKQCPMSALQLETFVYSS